MTIQVGSAASSGEKEIKTDWPITEGLIAGTTKQEGTKKNLEYSEYSNVPDRKKVGL